MDGPADGLDVYLRGYSRLAGLNLSEERLTELEPELDTLFADMRKLWSIPVGETEAAIGFGIERLARDV